jgi:hypothetical protein
LRMKLVQEITDDNNKLAPTSIGIMRWEEGRLGCALVHTQTRNISSHRSDGHQAQPIPVEDFRQVASFASYRPFMR